MADIDIRHPGDRVIKCPRAPFDCKVLMTLAPVAVETMLAENYRCREHGELLVVEG